VIAVCHRGLRRKAQRAPQQAIAHGRRQEFVGAGGQRLVAAGAREEQRAELLRLLVGAGKRGKLPGCRECAPVAGGE
jgi:hypothetical protein